MKYLNRLIPVFVLASCMAATAYGQDYLGVYAGSYVCEDGEHGFYLRIDETADPEEGQGYVIHGVMGFFPVLGGSDGPLAHVSGSFEIVGVIAEGRIWTDPLDWLQPVPEYGAARLAGTIAPRSDGLMEIIGKPVVPGNEEFCSDLIATQFLP